MTMLVEAPSTVRPEVRLTAEDLLRLPDSHGLELVDGKLVENNRVRGQAKWGRKLCSASSCIAEPPGTAGHSMRNVAIACFRTAPTWCASRMSPSWRVSV